MQLRIGIAESASSELVIELADDEDQETITARIASAATHSSPLVWFVDRVGTRFGVALDRINYIQLDE